MGGPATARAAGVKRAVEHDGASGWRCAGPDAVDAKVGQRA